jgi:type I restriction enzyme S subunit
VDRRNSGVPYLTSKNIGHGMLKLDDVDYIGEVDFDRLFPNNSKAVRRPRPGDLLTGIIGTFGNSYLYRDDDRFGVSSAVAILRPHQIRLLPKYLYYCLTSPSFRATHRAFMGGSVQGYTNLPTIRQLPIVLPPLTKQKAIAAMLGALDDKIELNRRMNATLEAMARAFFQSWFVDFDPVRAKLDGRQPTGLDPATAALFPNEFEESELGPIPKGWTVERVGDVVSCVGGSTPSTTEPKFWEGGVHSFATPKDLSQLDSPVLIDTERRITDAGVTQMSSGLLPAGTLLLSSRAPVGYLAIAATPVAINQGFIALKCNERASNYFMLNWCRSNMIEIESRASGTTFAEISKQNFRPIPLILPPKDLMGVFTKASAPLYGEIATNVHQSRTLAAIRDALLPQL